MSARKIGPLLLTVFSVILGLIWLAPLFWLVTTALTETTFNMSFLPNSPFTFQNINYVWHAVPFGQYYMNTLILVIVTFCIQFVTSTMAAYSLAFLDYRGKSLVFVIIFMQIIIPNDVLIIPNYLTLSEIGLMPLERYGVYPSAALTERGEPDVAFLVLSQTKNGTGAVDDMFCRQAASVEQVDVISVSYHWNNYLWPLIVTRSPQNRPLTVGLAIFAKSKEADMQWSNVCAATLIIILPLLLAFFIMQKQFMNSFIGAGVKE